MNFFQNFTVGMKEHGMYLMSYFTTGALMVPRWEFFEDIAENIPQDAGAILELGVGSGRLMDVIVERRNLLRKDGLYVAVDCNEESMDFIRTNRPRLVADHRVHLVTDFAQNIEGKLQELLSGRKLDATIVSIPHSLLSWEDVHAIWDMVARNSNETAIGILYNMTSRRTLMEQYWKSVQTSKTNFVHYGVPPEFEVNVGRGPKNSPEQARR